MWRADRFATLHVFHPLSKRMIARKRRVPILMYHSVSESEQARKHAYYQTATTPGMFAQQMRFLAENDYTALTVPEALGILKESSKGPRKPVAITFDDGFEDFYTHAFPILRNYQFRATMYLPAAYIGTAPRRLNGRQCLTWVQARELSREGVQFGAHTNTHPKLVLLDKREIQTELQLSKSCIEHELQAPIRSFAYPYAFPESNYRFRATLRKLLAETGYEDGVSTILGTAEREGDRYFLPRLPVNSLDDPRLFRAKLEGGYDWLHSVQYAVKAARSHMPPQS